ncbi:MAG: hypothetical protein IKO75_02090 [Bacteroidales bacterium]|nr:hypothetical protein [Bacteroidales bacterium]
MMKKTFCVIYVVMAMMAARCGKMHTCYCASYTGYDIVDSALVDSVGLGWMPMDMYFTTRESAVECSYWNYRDSVGEYLPEWGVRTYYVLECYEQGEGPRMYFSNKREK